MSLQTLLSTPISDPIPTESLIPYLISPPFHQVPGTFNLRNTAYPPLVQSNLLYRSGLLSHITDEGKKILVENLGIKAIFDLRFKEETVDDAEPTIEGAESVETGVEEKQVEGDRKGAQWQSLEEMYLFILGTHQTILKKVFLHILNSPGKPFLIHCTAGKDRTAAAIALILSLAGVPEEDILHDYTLTRIGIEPVRELLQAKLVGGDDKVVDWQNEEVQTLAGCKAESMASFLRELEIRYDGGAEGYVKGLGFNNEEIEKIKKSLAGV